MLEHGLGQFQVFIRGGSMKGGRRTPRGGIRGILPRKLLKFQVLGNAISAILRLDLVMNLLHLRLTVLILYFCKFLTLTVLILYFYKFLKLAVLI